MIHIVYNCNSLAECYYHIDNLTKLTDLLHKSKVIIDIDENSKTDSSYINLFNRDLHHPNKKVYNLEELEKNTILEIIQTYPNINDEEIASMLGIGVRTLYRKYIKHKIYKKQLVKK